MSATRHDRKHRNNRVALPHEKPPRADEHLSYDEAYEQALRKQRWGMVLPVLVVMLLTSAAVVFVWGVVEWIQGR